MNKIQNKTRKKLRSENNKEKTKLDFLRPDKC